MSITVLVWTRFLKMGRVGARGKTRVQKKDPSSSPSLDSCRKDSDSTRLGIETRRSLVGTWLIINEEGNLER